MKPEATTSPLANPRHEIYAVERAAGLNEEDAIDICGIEWPMPMEPGEKLLSKRSRVQTQALRRLDARIKVLEILNTGVDKFAQREFWIRNSRAIAELAWFRLIVDNSGCEPDFDENDQPIAPHNSKEQAA